MVASRANFCNSVWNWSARRSASVSIAARTDLASITPGDDDDDDEESIMDVAAVAAVFVDD